jgi:hypothetical protein
MLGNFGVPFRHKFFMRTFFLFVGFDNEAMPKERNQPYWPPVAFGPPRICRPGCALTLLFFLRHPPDRLVGNLVGEKLVQVVEKLAQTRSVEFAMLVPRAGCRRRQFRQQ